MSEKSEKLESKTVPLELGFFWNVIKGDNITLLKGELRKGPVTHPIYSSFFTNLSTCGKYSYELEWFLRTGHKVKS